MISTLLADPVILSIVVGIVITYVILSHKRQNDPKVNRNESNENKTPVQALPKAEIPDFLRPNPNRPTTLGIPKDQLMELPQEPVTNPKDRRITPEMLSQCCLDGKALWIGCYSQIDKVVVVFDVSSRPDFYGVGGSYSMLAGRDASYPLGAMALNDAALSITDISKLTSRQTTTLFEWFTKLKQKYPIMGYLWPHKTGLSLHDPLLPVEDEEEELPYIDQTGQNTSENVKSNTSDNLNDINSEKSEETVQE